MQMLIDGKKCDASDRKVIEVINPATGNVYDTVPSASIEDIERTLDIANKKKNLWADTPLHERAKILNKFVDLLEKHDKEVAEILTKETGKPFQESLNEIGEVYPIFIGYPEKAKHLYGDVFPESSVPGYEHDLIFTRREPLGVVAAIIPFNFPLNLFSHKVAPALIMGNSVIVKPASVNPCAVIRISELLLEAGVPGPALQVLTGSGSKLGNYLAASPKINAISLTGGTAAGIEVAKAAAPNLTRVYLELGGNDAFIVLEDGDIDFAVEQAIFARTYHCGQICCSSKRFIISAKVADEFVNKLINRLSKIKIGDPMDSCTVMGCLVSESAAIEVEQQIDKTIKQGAECVYGNKRNGAFHTPTVLRKVTPDMDIAKDMEIFGPVFPIIEFEDEDDAIKIANSSIYGLDGCVFTKDMKKSIKFAEKLECGAVVINGTSCYRAPQQSFGGYKKSGIGREGFSVTLDEYSQIKNYIFKEIR
ncbi:MAG: aldehyde dehydrogenase family protein [Actinobacteria bacterium]|nr:aldehyde dehydrogenase family protein [Actinomycetota bacterium]